MRYFFAEIEEKCKNIKIHNSNKEEIRMMIDDIIGNFSNKITGRTR